MSIQHIQTVFDADTLTGSEKLVLLAYCNYTDPHGYCWPGIDRIADMTGLSRRGVLKIRKQLIERGLLATASRVGRGGARKTNITRVNLSGLKALRRPEKSYSDDVIAELNFNTDPSETRSDQPRCTTCTRGDQPRCTTCTYQVNHVHHMEGAPRAPYPSEEPSKSSSSARAGVKPATPCPRPSSEKEEEEEEEEKKTTNKKKRGDSETPRTKTPEDRAIRVVLDRLADHSPTEDEAQAVITHIRTQATQRGTSIARIDKWIDGRDPGALAADLAHVRATTRRHQRPNTNTCKIHGDKRLPCIYCRMSAHAGDWTDLITELQRAGAEARPDLDALVHEYGVEHLLAA